jgi:hypothetical protein
MKAIPRRNSIVAPIIALMAFASIFPGSPAQTNVESRPEAVTVLTGIGASSERFFVEEIRSSKAKLKDPSPSAFMRQAIEHSIKDYERRLQDHRKDVMLWTRLHVAKANNDKAEVTRTEAELATFLTDRLGIIEGKKYSTNLPLSSVAKAYERYLQKQTAPR